MLPVHLDRALHATCGRISEEDDADVLEPVVATVADILSRMGDPPSQVTLQGWLLDLEQRALLERLDSGWRVTKEGWRAVNLMLPSRTAENEE